jgi:hypothetical protein
MKQVATTKKKLMIRGEFDDSLISFAIPFDSSFSHRSLYPLPFRNYLREHAQGFG